MPLIHKNSRNIFLQKLPILLHSNCFLQGKIAKARQCINRAIFEEKYFLKFYDVFSSWESTWSIKWVCEGCNTAEIFKIFKCQILTSLWTHHIKDSFLHLPNWNIKTFPSYIIGVYTAETVHPKIRNNLTILPSIFTSIGMLSVWIIGFFAHWRTTAYIFMIPHIVIFLCMLPLPESPYWLIEANKIDLAEYDSFHCLI